jgi:hypothetical protein
LLLLAFAGGIDRRDVLTCLLTLDDEFDDAEVEAACEVRGGGAYPHLQVERLAASASVRLRQVSKIQFRIDFQSVWVDLHFWISLNILAGDHGGKRMTTAAAHSTESKLNTDDGRSFRNFYG